MWTTRLTQGAKSGAHNVVLSRGDLTFVISLDDWWIMSAAQYLADKALKDNDLDFKASELYGPPRSTQPLWTTEMVATEQNHEVRLLRDGVVVAVFSLDEFSKLGATEYVVEDAVEVAEGFTQYGDNIDQVKAHFDDEFGDHDDEPDDEDPVREPHRKPTEG